MARDLVLLARQDGHTVIESHGAIIILMARPSTADRLDVAAAAKLAGCTPRRVREAARAGELPGCAIGERALSFSRADVIVWIESHPIRVRGARDTNDDAERSIADAMDET